MAESLLSCRATWVVDFIDGFSGTVVAGLTRKTG
jgi:hypothetical protein